MTLEIRNRNEFDCIPIIAVSIHSKDIGSRSECAKNNCFAVEYTPDPLSPHLITSHIEPFIQVNIPIRFHCRFSEYEIGNINEIKAEEALQAHLHVINAIQSIDNSFLTVHLSLNRQVPFNTQTGIKNLTRLVEYGRSSGITVCLENLRTGPASDPYNVLEWSKLSGSMITLDIGHAVSSDIVQSGKLTVVDIVNLFYERIREVHIYGKEEDRHYPVTDISPLKSVIDRLLESHCIWWTIELDDFEEVLSTRRILKDYIQKRVTEER